MRSHSQRSGDLPTPDGGRSYVANRLVVKFKSEGATSLAHSAHTLLATQGQPADLETYQSITRLNNECSLKSVRGLFFDRRGVDTPDARAAQEQLVARIRAKYPARSRRAPGTPVPDLTNYYVLEFAEGADAEAYCRHYQANPFVESAELDTFVRHQHIPNDPFFQSRGSWGQDGDDLWGLKKIEMEKAWDLSQGEGIVVAVVDTGIDYNHPDIAANVWTNPGEIAVNGRDDDENGFVDDLRGWNFADNTNDPMDTDNHQGHGTHTAGIIAAVGDNGLGIIGVAPKAKVMAVKHAGGSGSPVSSATAAALLYAVANGADVINNSWVLPGGDAAIADVIRFAHALGVVVVFATGNNPPLSPLIPREDLLTLTETIKVAATLPDDSPATFSCWGRRVDVAAPGGGSPSLPHSGPRLHKLHNILSLRAGSVASSITRELGVGDRYLLAFGTSAAAPYVSGLAALILARRPGLTNEQVRQVLRASADPTSEGDLSFRTGYGRINAARALEVDYPPVVRILEPTEGLSLGPETKTVRVCGIASGPLLRDFQLFYSRLDDLTHKQPIGSPVCSSTEGELLCWDVGDLPVGAYLLRLVATNREGWSFEDSVQVVRENPAIVHLTHDSAQRPGLSISGQWITWLQRGVEGGDYQLVLLDVDAGSTKVIGQFKVRPVLAASGDSIVYDFNDDHGSTLRFHDVRSGDEQTIVDVPEVDIPPDKSSAFERLAVSGKKVVWTQIAPDTSKSVIVQDVSSGETKTIDGGATGAGEGGLAIEGDKVVLSNGSEIILHDLGGGAGPPITLDARVEFGKTSPAMSGDNIVWLEHLGSGRNNIRHHDLRTGETRTIRQNLDLILDLKVSGDKVVWADARNGNYDVYLYDLDADKETAITTGLEHQNFPAIAGNRVVWITVAGDSENIDLFEIPNSCPSVRPVVTDR